MNYKLIIIILLLIILIYLYKKKVSQQENFTLSEVLRNIASVYEESGGTLAFQNLKSFGNSYFNKVIVNGDLNTRNSILNSGGSITNTGSGGIVNTGGNITNRGKLINTGSAKITESLEVLGDISGNLASLKGMIVMWSGTIGSIPEGWKLCDGQNGTPDLRSRFIVGAATPGAVLSNGLTIKSVNGVGGEERVTLNITQIPPHTHSGYATNNNTCDCGGGGCICSIYQTTTGSSGGTATGNTAPHDNMPPYYALAYIMKV